MIYFDCYRSQLDKANQPHRFTSHASENGVRTLCGRLISLKGNWTYGSGYGGKTCRKCNKKMEKT